VTNIIIAMGLPSVNNKINIFYMKKVVLYPPFF